MKFLLITLIHIYKKISLLFPYHSCRFHPSCSSYAQEAIMRYGAIKGVYKSICRILRCHPYHKGGYDPVK